MNNWRPQLSEFNFKREEEEGRTKRTLFKSVCNSLTQFSYLPFVGRERSLWRESNIMYTHTYIGI